MICNWVNRLRFLRGSAATCELFYEILLARGQQTASGRGPSKLVREETFHGL